MWRRALFEYCGKIVFSIKQVAVVLQSQWKITFCITFSIPTRTVHVLQQWSIYFSQRMMQKHSPLASTFNLKESFPIQWNLVFWTMFLSNTVPTQIFVFSPLQAECQKHSQLQTECLVSVTWRCDTLVNNHTVLWADETEWGLILAGYPWKCRTPNNWMMTSFEPDQ